ncbi:uncharacterized protein LOC133880749 isoform X2 [Alnus glutinosa]|uniref:uncharacterized protein LOC133880749 isoform X2 n=1 Tax=Alnus glutinosa TaxID=3517 RepID=UPI002D799D45|nr:uncharacterized protein LOC133880749 isoform X2 [Alnus glutinosa]
MLEKCQEISPKKEQHAIGVQQGHGKWVHYAIHLHEPHITLFCYGPKGSHEHLSSQKGMEKGRDYPKCSIPRNKLIEIVNIRRYALLLMQFNFIIFRDVVYPNRQIPF